MSVIQRAKFMDKFMTGFFYIVAGFFLLLLLAFTLYVIIKGFANFTPNMFSFFTCKCSSWDCSWYLYG